MDLSLETSENQMMWAGEPIGPSATEKSSNRHEFQKAVERNPNPAAIRSASAAFFFRLDALQILRWSASF